jgi:hypothetical protein
VVRIRSDLALVVVLALAACLCAAILPTSVAALRAPLCVPLVLLLPGYAAVQASFRPGELRTPELITLSIAFSIGATIVAALLLALLGVRLTTAPWMGLLTALTLAAAARAGARGHARPIVLRVRPAGRRVRRAEAGALACALALLIGAATLGFTPLAAPKSTRGTTALWLVPAPHGRHAACVGVINEQLHSESYVISVLAVGTPVQRFGPVTLAPGGRWSRAVAVGSRRPVVLASLSLTDNATVVYRSVELRAWNLAVAHC